MTMKKFPDIAILCNALEQLQELLAFGAAILERRWTGRPFVHAGGYRRNKLAQAGFHRHDHMVIVAKHVLLLRKECTLSRDPRASAAPSCTLLVHFGSLCELLDLDALLRAQKLQYVLLLEPTLSSIRQGHRSTIDLH
jgi:hypothetical protein